MNIQKHIDKILPIGGLVRTMPYVMVFKTTNYCWFKCPHCCENSGPNQPKKFIPLDVIHYYLSQAVRDPQFSGNVVFTGGEIMSSYRFGDPAYVPTLLNTCLQANIGTDIKTNAGWARTSFGKQIFDDIATVVHNHPKNRLQISLSLDKFHTNCIENNAMILKHFANAKLPITVHISSFSDCSEMFPEMLKRLKKCGIRVDDMLMFNPKTKRGYPVTLLNESVIIKQSFGTLFDGGRAKSLSNAMHTQFPQFKFMLPGGQILMAFDSFGRVTLGENSGRKISAPWMCDQNKHIWKLPAIKSMLVANARAQELRAMVFDGWKHIR